MKSLWRPSSNRLTLEVLTLRFSSTSFHFDEVHHILSELIQGGLVLETNINEIVIAVAQQSKLRKASATSNSVLGKEAGVGGVAKGSSSPRSVGGASQGSGMGAALKGWLAGGR